MECMDYQKYMKPAEIEKAVNTLSGILQGVTIDNLINVTELNEFLNWVELHRVFSNRQPFKEIFEVIDTVMEDGVLTDEEVEDLLYVCTNMSSDSSYYGIITAGVQELEGILHGILADNEISDDEIKGLSNWISENDFLKGTYPFDEIDSLLLSVLSDKVITQEEKERLMVHFSSFVDMSKSNNIDSLHLSELKKQYQITGICAACPDIKIQDRLFCFTGASAKASRDEIAERIIGRGGYFKSSVTDKTNYLVVGNDGNPCWAFSCYGRKVEKAMSMRREGHPILIVNEVDFWDVMVE